MAWECSRANPEGPALRVTPRCVVCGSGKRQRIASAKEMRAQMRYLRAFHRRRLLPNTPASMLTDKVCYTQSQATHIVACGNCGHLYRCPRPTADDVLDAYARDHYTREKMDALLEAARPFYARQVAVLSHRLSRQPRVLEVGSYVGAFLEEARAAGWHATGVDIGHDVGAYTRARGLDVLTGQLPEVDLPAESFDAVFLWNCLDQLPDPWPVLRRARELLRPGGLLVARVPHGACFRLGMALLHRRLPCPLRSLVCRTLAFNNLLAFPYLHGYTEASLHRLLTTCGLRVDAITGDTMGSLADQYTRVGAVREEARLKAAHHQLMRLGRLLHTGSALWPWMNVAACR